VGVPEVLQVAGVAEARRGSAGGRQRVVAGTASCATMGVQVDAEEVRMPSTDSHAETRQKTDGR